MKLSGSYWKNVSALTLSFLLCLLLLAPPAFALTVLPDSSVFIQIVNFLVLIWILNTVLYRPIRSVLQQRKEKVEGLEDKIETCTREVQEKDEAFVNGLREARVKGLQEKDRFLQEAAEEEKAIIEEINKKSMAELEAIRAQVAQDTDKVRGDLMSQVDGFAGSIVEKILGRAIS
ncbi:MAG: ATP synthase F0 subunit B [Desulfobacterales bacterium]|nr:ATP synthase F0 subunit B [Desulfobacterales bacterium]